MWSRATRTLTSRFAFIDFESTAKATAALLEPRNGRLLGRELIREYAGVDAIRRGARRHRAGRRRGGCGVCGGGARCGTARGARRGSAA